MRPLVGLGAKLSASVDRGAATHGSPIIPSFLLGVATGFLWAPCAGPVLGLILTGAALKGASIGTSLLLLAYAAGAATSLALALLIGGRVFATMKRSLGAGEWVRRGLGIAVLVAVAAVALGLDTGLLTRVSLSSTASLDVRAAVSDLKIGYPVAVDNEYKIWRAFDNEYWPAHYFIDAQGHMRYHHFGEGEYDESERVIQQLLAEAGNSNRPTSLVSVNASGAEAPPSLSDDKSPETYIGYDRAQNFISSTHGVFRDQSNVYAMEMPRLNHWSLSGDWTIAAESATLNEKGGRIVYRFRGRDLHLVLGPAVEGNRIRFRVTIDGAAPGADHGTDIDADGQGVVDGQRLYQLVRQSSAVSDRTFEIEFLDPGVQAYAFTFG